MAKLKGPLFSLGASAQLGKTLVYFSWKGLNVVREYVIPSNPKTALQTTQRGYLTAAVDEIHLQQAAGSNPLSPADIAAYNLLASLRPTPRTWFNELCKMLIDLLVGGLDPEFPTDGTSTPGSGQILMSVFDNNGAMTAGDFWYGTSKSALINSVSASLATGEFTATPTGLVAGVKYYWQFRPTAPAGNIGGNSGIYFSRPT